MRIQSLRSNRSTRLKLGATSAPRVAYEALGRLLRGLATPGGVVDLNAERERRK